MTYAAGMQISKLRYDRERGIIEFSMRRSFDGTAIVINGEVPLMITETTGRRPAAKATVRQALLDAANALEDIPEHEIEEGIRPEDLNATNDD